MRPAPPRSAPAPAPSWILPSSPPRRAPAPRPPLSLWRAGGVPVERRYRGALWFCWSIALTQGKIKRGARKKPKPATQRLRRAVASYARAVEGLRAAVPLGTRPAAVRRSDARALDWVRRAGHEPGGVAAVITSPPYPAVYDYLSDARAGRAQLGGRDAPDLRARGGVKAAAAAALWEETVVEAGSRDWEREWVEDEIGSQKQFRKLARQGINFRDVWQDDQEKWLRAVHDVLASGGRAAVMTGDGDDSTRIDSLDSTCRAAEAVGLTVRAAASIWTKEWKHRAPGNRRTEHIILLEKP